MPSPWVQDVWWTKCKLVKTTCDGKFHVQILCLKQCRAGGECVIHTRDFTNRLRSPDNAFGSPWLLWETFESPEHRLETHVGHLLTSSGHLWVRSSFGSHLSDEWDCSRPLGSILGLLRATFLNTWPQVAKTSTNQINKASSPDLLHLLSVISTHGVGMALFGLGAPNP